MRLTGWEIKDLALLAGLEVMYYDVSDETLDEEYVIVPCPKEGLVSKNGVDYFRHLMYSSDYPEDGVFGLGKPLEHED